MTSAQGYTRKIDVDVACHSEPSTCALDPVDYMPNEILWMLLGFLSAEDLCHLAVCSKAWRNVTNTNSLWLRLCKLRDWERFGKEVDLRQEKPIIHSAEIITYGMPTSQTFQANSVIAGDCSLDLAPTCNWKEVYMRAGHLKKNWSEGRYQEHRVVLSELCNDRCIATDGMIFGAGDSLGYVRLWNLNSGKLLQNIQPSQYLQRPLYNDTRTAIKKLVMKNNIGLAAYTGGILVFKASTGNVLKLIQGTASDFYRYNPNGLYMEVGKVIVCYCHDFMRGRLDGIPVHIWDISGLVEGEDNGTCTETKLCTRSLNVSPGKYAKCFAYHGHLVITSFEDNTAFILWDTRAPEHARIYRGHSGKIYSGHLDENTIMTGDDVGQIKVWTTKSDVCVKNLTFSAHYPLREVTATLNVRHCPWGVSRLFFNDKGIAAVLSSASFFKHDLVFWSRDGSCKLNEYKNEKRFCDYKVHGNRVVTPDPLTNKASVWELSTGKCRFYDHNNSGSHRKEIVYIDDTKMVIRVDRSNDVFILHFL